MLCSVKIIRIFVVSIMKTMFEHKNIQHTADEFCSLIEVIIDNCSSTAHRFAMNPTYMVGFVAYSP